MKTTLTSVVKNFARSMVDATRVLACRHFYGRTLRRIRAYPSDRKVRVLFVCSNVSKWKCQSVYEAMMESDIFDPYVVLTHPSDWVDVSEARLVEMMDELKSFFKKHGCRVLVAYSASERRPIPYKIFNPDIVFFQEPWSLFQNQSPLVVARYALCCYVPYYVQISLNPPIHCFPLFFRCQFVEYVLNNKWRDGMALAMGGKLMAGALVAVGHPCLDVFWCKKNNGEQPTRDLVIYAPHFSFNHPNNISIFQYGTFEWNGHEILNYAQRHPEIKWVFKPHPSLADKLRDSGYMTQREVLDYYAAWAEIGQVCLEGNYQWLFMRARAMITDCDSFLAEFGVTGMPILHLITAGREAVGRELSQQYLDTYYKVSTLDDMFNIFEQVLERGEDPLRDERLAALRACGLVQNKASLNIIEHLQKCFGR